MKVFEKKLSPTERARHWVRVPTADRENFPPRNEPFRVKIGSETVEVHIDSSNRILGFGWSTFDKLGLDSQKASIIVEKTSLGEYVLKKK